MLADVFRWFTRGLNKCFFEDGLFADTKEVCFGVAATAGGLVKGFYDFVDSFIVAAAGGTFCEVGDVFKIRCHLAFDSLAGWVVAVFDGNCCEKYYSGAFYIDSGYKFAAFRCYRAKIDHAWVGSGCFYRFNFLLHVGLLGRLERGVGLRWLAIGGGPVRVSRLYARGMLLQETSRF